MKQSKYSCSLIQDKTSIERLLNIEGYKAHSFNDVFIDVTRKGRKIKANDYSETGKYPIVDQSNEFIGGYIDDRDDLFEDYPVIIFGDHTRCLKYVDFSFHLGADGVKVLKNKLGEEKASTRFLYYYLKNVDIPNTGYNRHFKYIKELLFVLPPLEIQIKIVEALDKAQRLIGARKEQIRLMDELIKSVFYEMFGDPVTNPKKINQLPLGELCNLKAGKFIKAAQISDLYEEKLYPCYGGNGLRGYVEEYTHDSSYPLIGRQGALCGNVQFAEGKFYATEHAIVAQPKADLDITWLYIMLREMNLNRLATGAAQPGLNVSTLMVLEVIYPEISLQTEFAKKFKEIEIQKSFMKKSLIDIESNYYGLLQKVFSGKLF